MLHRRAHTVELTGNVHGKRAVPLFRWNFVDASGWTRNAGVIDEAIKSAERICRCIDNSRNGIPVRDIAQQSLQLRGRWFLAQPVRCDRHRKCERPRPRAGRRAPTSKTDAGGASRNDDTQPFDAKIHDACFPANE